MTYATFLTKLQETPKEVWILHDEDGLKQIRATSRRGVPPCCPITAVDGFRLSAGYFQDSAWRLGIDPEMMLNIVDAADEAPRHDPNIRLDLLKATGLSEEGA